MNRVQTILESHGLPATQARLKLLSICIQSHVPLDVVAVAARIGNQAHLATIYRTLEIFVKVGILERIDFQEGKFRYEYVEHHHHHAVCEHCGDIEDIMLPDLEQDAARISNKLGFHMSKHIIELFGTCKKCFQKGQYVK